MPAEITCSSDVLRLLVGEDQGLSVTAFSSMSSTRLAWASASRTAPCTCGMQRGEVAVLRLVLLAAAERAEAAVELLAAMALPERHPVPADVEVSACGRIVPAAGQPRPERGTRWYGMSEGGAIQQAQQVRGGTDHSRDAGAARAPRGKRAEPAGERIERHRRGEVGGVSRSSSACTASTPVASICAVPLFSAKPSLYDSATGASPLRASASRPGTRSPSKLRRRPAGRSPGATAAPGRRRRRPNPAAVPPAMPH